jgi:predicted protein tyrosine phosphatase
MVNKKKATKVTVGNEPTYGSTAADKEQNIEVQPGRILFVCDNATNRAPAFEEYFSKKYQNVYITKFAGVEAYDEKHQLDDCALIWADAVFCMDVEQIMWIRQHYPAYASKLWLVGINDRYESPSKALSTVIVFWDNYMFKEYNNIRLANAARKYAEDNRADPLMFTPNEVEAAAQEGINISLYQQEGHSLDFGEVNTPGTETSFNLGSEKEHSKDMVEDNICYICGKEIKDKAPTITAGTKPNKKKAVAHEKCYTGAYK